MGIFRLRGEDVSLAMASDHLDRGLLRRRSPTAILRAAWDEIGELGVVVVRKPSSSLRWSKVSTTFYREIRVATDFDDYPDERQAVVLAHELVHVRQWRSMPARNFGAKYVLSARFRWASEMQAYRETVRAKLALGQRDEPILRWIEDLARRMPGGLYELGLLRASDVVRCTAIVLQETLRGERKRMLEGTP